MALGASLAGEAHAEAAFRPNPLEPPVTTTTLPFREKSEG